jgi:hypothetical protein
MRVPVLRVAYLPPVSLWCSRRSPAFVAAAGVGPLYDALVRFPLESYHPAIASVGDVSLWRQATRSTAFPGTALRTAGVALPLARIADAPFE